jgi:two-component system, OmpR family, response regulator
LCGNSTTKNTIDSIHDQMNINCAVNAKSSSYYDESKDSDKDNFHSDARVIYHDITGQQFNRKEEEDGNSIISKELKQLRILIAESEPEILTLFKTNLDSLGIESVTVDDGDKAVETFIQSKNQGKNYDAVVLNTHLKGKKGLDAAKKIRENDHSQRIILLTTSMKEHLSKEKLKSTAIEEKDILVMPFKLSKFQQILRK